MSDPELDLPECFFTRSGSIFECHDIGAVKAPQVRVDKAFFIEMTLRYLKDGIEMTCNLPRRRCCRPNSMGQHAGVEYPENAVEHLVWLTVAVSTYAVI